MDQEQLAKAQALIDTFKEKIVAKFGANVAGIAVLPAGARVELVAEQEPVDPKTVNAQEVNVLVLMDDTDSTKMSKLELKEKLSSSVSQTASEVDEGLVAQTLIYSELWQYCFDAKHAVLHLLASSYIVYDTGMLSAIKITEVHKSMVLKKFEKYIVAYVLAGSLVQGKATATSDVDVFVVIDDTDVKKMTRAELKDRLRAMVVELTFQAGQMTGIKNKMNIQTYILTDFWEMMKEANPVAFTFLRDGVPFYDRGIFMPWKQLLRMGKIRPSMEAIDIYRSSGEQMLERIKYKLNEIGMEDTYWAILYPAQAALMLYGLPPPTPKETPELLRKVFVKKEGILEEKYVKILEANLKVRKDLEHGNLKKISGKEVDDLVASASDYLARFETLFQEMALRQQKQAVASVYDQVITIIRDIVRLEGVKTMPEEKVVSYFEKHVVEKGQVPQHMLSMLHTLVKAKKDFDENALHKAEIEKVNTYSQELIRDLIDVLQRKRGLELERMKIKVKHGSKYGEVILLDTHAYIVHDIDDPAKSYTKAPLLPNGSLGQVSDASLEEVEKALSQVSLPKRAFIKDAIFADLKKIFGKDVEVLVSM
jgi:uncharacterized protein (UPF0332 family)/predicted nucleotidyltransferase